MRPVQKIEMRDPDGSEKEFKPYDRAKNHLEENLGLQCSYCERTTALSVEHVRAKSIPRYPHLEFRWDNFLLACVHCNSIKGEQNVTKELTLIPHWNNSFLAFKYSQGGRVSVAKDLKPEDQKKAEYLMKLTGIHRDPSHSKYSYKDDRWSRRL
jgi:uncharacterized protein (TIGR02646 family)